MYEATMMLGLARSLLNDLRSEMARTPSESRAELYGEALKHQEIVLGKLNLALQMETTEASGDETHLGRIHVQTKDTGEIFPVDMAPRQDEQQREQREQHERSIDAGVAAGLILLGGALGIASIHYGLFGPW